jgi:hypothetical protein
LATRRQRFRRPQARLDIVRVRLLATIRESLMDGLLGYGEAALIADGLADDLAYLEDGGDR